MAYECNLVLMLHTFRG